jgi:LmbE family N-acetylglucosaminyl deacetylase
MERREFIAQAMTGAALGGGRPGRSGAAPQGAAGDVTAATANVVFIERALAGKPHTDKVLAAIQPHADDIPIYAAGTIAKLLNEGYTGYLIRTTNDDMTGGGTIGEGTLANERDNQAVAKVLGLQKVFDLNYNNHRMDQMMPVELRARLIFLFRLLKVDTVVCYDPWGHYEENPDHYVTARAVEASCWMAGMGKDFPEHLAAGLEPHLVQEKYYFARGPQLVNRVVDIGPHIDKKVEVNRVNKAQGPAGEAGARLRASLAARKLRLPILGNDDETANQQYIKEFVLANDREVGHRYGLEYAEEFHYIGPEASPVENYVKQHAIPLE